MKKKYQSFAFAKLNLTLRVLSKLKSGNHKIQTVITFCTLKDKIELAEIDLNYDKIIFTGKFGKGISRTNNTVSKLLKILREKKFIEKTFFSVVIKKEIPCGAGLGGGSSNAASVLNILKKKYHLRMPKKIMIDIASRVGYDVPLCIDYNNKLVNGSNKQFDKIKRDFNLYILIVYPNLINSTEKVYKSNRLFSQKNLKLKKDLLKSDFIKTLINEKNDLQSVVAKKSQRVKSLINILSIQKDCLFSRMSGSGSACFGVFKNLNSANRTKRLLKNYYPSYWSVVSKTM